MRKKYFDASAQYFVRFLKGYGSEGVKVDAVTTQNEEDTDRDGRSAAMPECLRRADRSMGWSMLRSRIRMGAGCWW
jgi:O-glycosyl hydrolase